MIRALTWPFSFRGKLDRVAFAIAAPIVFFSQHVAVLWAFYLLGQPVPTGVGFAIAPLRALAQLEPQPELASLLGVLGLAVTGWILAALAFRRAAAAGMGPGWVTMIIAPVLQIPVYLILCVAPPRALDADAEKAVRKKGEDWTAAMQGLLAGVSLTTGAVVFGALVLHRYGYAMFIATPMMVGFVTACLANRRVDIGVGRTCALAMGAVLLGAFTLLAFALEGAICIIMAAPIEAAMAAGGAGLGHAAMRVFHHRSRTLMSAPILPLIFLSELLVSPVTPLRTVDRIDIAAPPAAVWQVLSSADRIAERPALPFRLGLAYPQGSRFEGQGVGSIRRGQFSTGEALEKVTAWEPNQELAFAVLTDPPSMRELSPYKVVHAPHAVGYFRTTGTRFLLQPLANGGTRLTLVGQHSMKLDPLIYWAPIADSIIKANTGRVLRHIKARAEGQP